MNDERKAKRVFIVLSVICAVFPGLVFLVYLLKIAGGLSGQQQVWYKYQEFHQDIYYVILLGFATIVPPLIAYLYYDEACHAKSADSVQTDSGSTLISQDGLTHERNIFLGGFGALIGLSLAIQLMLGFSFGLLLGRNDALEFSAIVVLIAKTASVYFVFRLSRYLRQPIWLTILFCMLVPFALIYLIPFIGLLVAVKKVRKQFEPVLQSPIPPRTKQTREPPSWPGRKNPLGHTEVNPEIKQPKIKQPRPLYTRSPLFRIAVVLAIWAGVFVISLLIIKFLDRGRDTTTANPGPGQKISQNDQRSASMPQEQRKTVSESYPATSAAIPERIPQKQRRNNLSIDQSLLMATNDGDVYWVNVSLKDGAQIECSDEEGNTALILAAFRCNSVLVKLLLDKGANCNAKNDRGNTALIQHVSDGLQRCCRSFVAKREYRRESQKQTRRNCIVSF